MKPHFTSHPPPSLASAPSENEALHELPPISIYHCGGLPIFASLLEGR